MDFNRDWTQFAADAETHDFGTARLVRVHNELRAEVKRLLEIIEAVKRETLTCGVWDKKRNFCQEKYPEGCCSDERVCMALAEYLSKKKES